MIYIDSNDSYFEKVEGERIVDGNYQDTFKSEDILLLDIDRFENINKVEEYFLKIPKSLKTVVFTSDPRLEYGAYLIKIGCKSYISKDTEFPVVKHALLTVASGNVWLYPDLLNFIIEKIDVSKDVNQDKSKVETLTYKEQEVAYLVAKGYSNKEIAEYLGVQVVTVKKHISSIFTKLELKDRLALAIFMKSL